MTDYGTIKIPQEDYERHNKRRKEMNLSWAEYIDGQAPDPPEVDIPPGIVSVIDATEEDIEEIKRQMENVPKRTADEIETRLR